jgi:hypothetical protein
MITGICIGGTMHGTFVRTEAAMLEIQLVQVVSPSMTTRLESDRKPDLVGER